MKLPWWTGDQVGAMVLPDERALPGAGVSFDVERAYAEHAGFIGRVIQRLTGDLPHVDDLLQETFIVAFKKRHEFRGDAAERTWLYAIAARLCLRHLRGARRLRAFRTRLAWQGSEPAPARPDRELERAESEALVREVLDRLPFAQREAFALFELEGMDGRAIAQLLGVPLGTVWTRLHHARARFEVLMRKRLGREIDEVARPAGVAMASEVTR